MVVSAYQGASPAGRGVETLPPDESGHLDLAELAIGGRTRRCLLEDLVVVRQLALLMAGNASASRCTLSVREPLDGISMEVVSPAHLGGGKSRMGGSVRRKGSSCGLSGSPDSRGHLRSSCELGVRSGASPAGSDLSDCLRLLGAVHRSNG